MSSFDTFRAQPFWTVLSELVPEQVREFRPSLVFSSCAAMLVASLLLGGGTRGGFLSDALLQLLAIPVLLMALATLVEAPRTKAANAIRAYWLLAFCFAIVFVSAIQLVPLPPSIWTQLPSRDIVESVFDLLGGARPWMPISVSPNATWLSLLSLLPPLAIFVAAIQINVRERRRLSLIVVAVAAVSALLGLLQVAQGPSSALRFFTVTNTTEAVGFFANRNHFAALMYTALLFAAVWAIHYAFKIRSWAELKSIDPFIIAAFTASFSVLVVLIAGDAVARSRAGLGLTIVALGGIFAIAFLDRRNTSGTAMAKLLLGSTILAVILIVQFALYRILDRFTADSLADARLIFAHNTIRAALAFMPFGSGVGTFVPVYAMFERPGDTMQHVYANHAHDDLLELWLETGIMGLLLLAAFLFWFGKNAVAAWRKSTAVSSEFDIALIRAATIVIALILLHSLVDYPLRTDAMMAIFAFSCALLVEPLSGTDAKGWPERSHRHAPRPMPKRAAEPGRVPALGSPPNPPARPASRPAAAPVATPVVGGSRDPGGRWGEGIEWPEEWRK
jgi:O-antigen ligase